MAFMLLFIALISLNWWPILAQFLLKETTEKSQYRLVYCVLLLSDMRCHRPYWQRFLVYCCSPWYVWYPALDSDGVWSGLGCRGRALNSLQQTLLKAFDKPFEGLNQIFKRNTCTLDCEFNRFQACLCTGNSSRKLQAPYRTYTLQAYVIIWCYWQNYLCCVCV